MANWKDVEVRPGFTFSFTYSDAADTAWSNVNTTITLQYNTESVSTTSVNVRFKVTSNCKTTDGLYLLYDPGNANRLFQIKPYNGATASTYYSSTFALTKSATASVFTTKSVWACNTGAGTVSGSKITYATGTDTFYNFFKSDGLRAHYAKRQNSVYDLSIEPEKTVVEKGTEPTIFITSGSNGYFTLSGSFASGGANNKLVSVGIYYTTDGSDPSASSSDRHTLIPMTPTPGGSYSYTMPIYNSCTVKAVIICELEAMTLKSAIKSLSITYYTPPAAPGLPALYYDKSRLTVKEPWTFTWSASSSSTVVGYYIMLLRCPAGETDFEFVRELTCSTSNDYIGISPGSNSNTNTNYYVKRASKSCRVVLEDPTDFGFDVGDKVKLRIRAYRTDGYGRVIQSAIVNSYEYEVQNAGIVHVKVGGAWKEGQVYAKVGGNWKEAASIGTKVNGSWKESQ